MIDARHILGAVALALSLAIAAPATAQSTLDTVKSRGTLVTGVRFDTPPYGSVDASGKNVGIDIDFANELARRLGVKLELVQVTGKTRIPLLTSGKIDLIVAALTHTRERDKVIDFTITYIQDGVKMLVRKNSGIAGPDDLKGKTVSTIQGSVNVPLVQKAAPQARILEYQEYPQAFLALKQGLAQAFVTDVFILEQFAKGDPDYAIVGPYLAEEPLAIGVRENDSKWRDELNYLLQDMVADGTWSRIMSGYISQPIPKPEVWPLGTP
jgi:polar amino acid transport system substrate-binding protein